MTLLSICLACAGLSLNGQWEFRLIASNGVDACEAATIEVPSCWEMKGFGSPCYDECVSGERGLYRRRFSLPKRRRDDDRLFLVFGGVMFGAEVKVNGRPVADFSSSFNEHEFDVTDAVDCDAENEIEVFTKAHPMGAEFDTNDDWTLHGIFRPVTLEWRPALRVRDWRIATRVDGPDAHVSVSADLTGPGELSWELVSADGKRVAGAVGTNATLVVGNAALWSAESPSLYILRRVVKSPAGEVSEVAESRVGLREITWSNRVLRVHGMPVKLRGVNHHDLSPVNGRAVTDEEQWRDARLIKEANCNFVRTSHYPPSRALLDACDQLGLYVMDEVPFGLGERFLDDPTYGPILVDRAERTLRRDANRACVVIWSVGNENPVTPLTRLAASRVKELDPSRPWCYPMQPSDLTNHLARGGVAADFGDLVNWHYPRYELSDEVLRAFLDSFDRPYLSGEYAHAYGLDGGLFESYWDDFMWRDPSYAGGAVWMFQDQGILRSAKDISNAARSAATWPEADRVWDSHGVDGTDGIVYSDRTPQTDYYELRKVYAPVRLGDANMGFSPGGVCRCRLPVENRFDMLFLDEGVSGFWRLYYDGKFVAGGELRLPHLPPHGEGFVGLEFAAPAGRCSVAHVEFAFKSRGDGRQVYERAYPLSVDVGSFWETRPLRLDLDESTCRVRLSDERGAVVLDSEILAAVDSRPMVAKDLTMANLSPWPDDLVAATRVRVVDSDSSRTVVKAAWSSGTNELEGVVTFSASESGIDVAYELRYPHARVLVETGLGFCMPQNCRGVEWVGDGPYEAYPRASMLSEFGIWSLDALDLRFAGNRRNVHAAAACADGAASVELRPLPAGDVAFWRFRGGIALVHNAFVAGKSAKFTKPLGCRELGPGEVLRGRFRLTGVSVPMHRVPPAFSPFHKTYDQ